MQQILRPLPELHLNLRSQVLRQDSGGHSFWEVQNTPQAVFAANTCVIICDMWDRHWCRGAVERVNAMAPHLNQLIRTARERGVWIIHAPSETLEVYRNSPARERMSCLPHFEPSAPVLPIDPPLPIDDSDGGADTGEIPWEKVWTRQHPAIEIDGGRDGISDSGAEIYNFIRYKGIERVLLAGVHTNMCILARSFGIKQMVRWGVPVALVRDMTDAMYNPARSPYVNHAEGTRLVIEYIEKFWCPTVLSGEIL